MKLQITLNVTSDKIPEKELAVAISLNYVHSCGLYIMATSIEVFTTSTTKYSIA